jgi:hypothetical protein
MSLQQQNNFRPMLETLEARETPSWASVPPETVNLNAGAADRIRINSFASDGNYVASNSITRQEIDYRTFVAQRSGSYTFEATTTAGRLDTVAALFSSTGKRLAFNDDINVGNFNSRFSVNLQAGQTYVLGVTNHVSSGNGSYRVAITAPNLSRIGAPQTAGSAFTSGDASLNGTLLRLHLYGSNSNRLRSANHRIEVRILDMYDRPIHSGSFSRNFSTSGIFVPGASTTNRYFDINLSALNINLSRASRLEVRLFCS